MKKLISMIKLDFKLIIKDKIALYMALAPALLSFVFLAVAGSVSEGTVKLAITADVPAAIVGRLEEVAELELFDDYTQMKTRVEGADSIAGIYMNNNTLAILVEGNEVEGFAEGIALLVNKALSEKPVHFISNPIETTENVLMTISMASVLLLAILIAGSVSGFNIVNERESGIIRALGISPMGLITYLTSRTITALVLGVINIAICIVIMGRANLVIPFIVVALASLFIYAMTALFLGSFADNQITAFATMKVIMPLFLIMPVISVFVPAHLHFLFYPLPMYWQYDSIVNILAGGSAGFSLLLILITGAFWFTVVLIARKKVFNIKMEGVR